MTNYKDTDLTFFMGLYRDQVRARSSLTALRKNFPESTLIIRSDGDSNSSNTELANEFNAHYYQEQRLYSIANGGAMAHRILELYLNHPSRVLFKMDTDTYFFRRFDYLPEREGIFGSVQKSRDGCNSVQGGGMGFTLDAAKAIWQSNLLLDSRLCRPFDFEDESPYFRSMARRVERCGLCSFDWMMGWAANELSIHQFDFEEIYCRWHRAPLGEPKPDFKYAAVHPVYPD